MTFYLTSDEIPELDELLCLYASVDWTAYTRDPEALARALRHSSFVWAARNEDGELVGLVRGLSDDVSILFVQDLLVSPDWQRRGVGRALIRAVLARYAHVMQMALLTDDGPEQLAFYESLGCQNTQSLRLNAFYRANMQTDSRKKFGLYRLSAKILGRCINLTPAVLGAIVLPSPSERAGFLLSRDLARSALPAGKRHSSSRSFRPRISSIKRSRLSKSR